VICLLCHLSTGQKLNKGVNYTDIQPTCHTALFIEIWKKFPTVASKSCQIQEHVPFVKLVQCNLLWTIMTHYSDNFAKCIQSWFVQHPLFTNFKSNNLTHIFLVFSNIILSKKSNPNLSPQWIWFVSPVQSSLLCNTKSYH